MRISSFLPSPVKLLSKVLCRFRNKMGIFFPALRVLVTVEVDHADLGRWS